ncbi:IS30 family transposase [Eubacterium sp. 1001713B170207_170306_E7]|uniref:IS30 family transposase n=1 Tax=Eubacterium sp. 1001713B170207_170306_E7 TaxID=2787097 RepID=UPI00189AE79D|nr:IS30 family transposase [Eubacterium sp. 1001713B170207_170306_E7]
MAAYMTLDQRKQIETCLKLELNTQDIADVIGMSERTVRREIKRGTIMLYNTKLVEYSCYCPDYAQTLADEASKRKGRKCKLADDPDFIEYIENKIINERWSPDVALGRARFEGKKFKTTICTGTLYNYIKQGRFPRLTINDLHRKGMTNKHKTENEVKSRKGLGNRRIDERPDKVETRLEWGHWEMDCIKSARGQKTGLLTIIERTSRDTLVFKLPFVSQACVKEVLDSLERKYRYQFKKIFKSITMDNGSEFIDQDTIETSIYTKKKRTTAYYCHPYRSSERGSNENVNGMVRRFVKKGVNIASLSEQFIKRVESWINNYPRKILGYRTSAELFGMFIQNLS